MHSHLKYNDISLFPSSRFTIICAAAKYGSIPPKTPRNALITAQISPECCDFPSSQTRSNGFCFAYRFLLDKLDFANHILKNIVANKKITKCANKNRKLSYLSGKKVWPFIQRPCTFRQPAVINSASVCVV